VINPATILNAIDNEAYAVGGSLGFPGKAPGAGNLANAAAYALIASQFVRDLAAKKVLERIKQDLAIKDMQFPSFIDEIAKKRLKKKIKGRVKAGDHL